MFWEPGNFVFLGTGGTLYSTGLSINDGDQVVGIMGDAPTGMAKLRKRLLAHRPSLLLPRTLDNSDRAMIWTFAMGIVEPEHNSGLKCELDLECCQWHKQQGRDCRDRFRPESGEQGFYPEARIVGASMTWQHTATFGSNQRKPRVSGPSREMQE